MRCFRVFLFLSLFSFQSEAKVLISTVAQVKSHVITTREVEIHNILSKAITSDMNKFKVEPSVEQITREWLLFYEASTFYANEIDSSLVNNLLAKARKNVEKYRQWKSLAVSNSELRKKIKRHLEAKRLYVFKRKASLLPVSNVAVETEYNQNRIKYGNLTLEEAKESIRQNKSNENLIQRMEQWFQVLEKKYKVQRFTKVS